MLERIEKLEEVTGVATLKKEKKKVDLSKEEVILQILKKLERETGIDFKEEKRVLGWKPRV